MEEVDAIVIHTLRQVGCEIEDDLILKEFSTELIVEGVVRCLKIINSNFEYSHHVPPGMSARYRLCSALANELKELGFKGEIGYQTFLYSNEHEVRKVFLFLFEKLPKESEKVLDEPLSRLVLVLKEVGYYFKESLSSPWLPYYCNPSITWESKAIRENKVLQQSLLSNVLFFPYFLSTWTESKKAQHTSYYNDCLLSVSRQASALPVLFSSVFERNQKRYVKENKSTWNNQQFSDEEVLTNKKENIQKFALDLIKQQVDKISNTDNFKRATLKSETSVVKGSRFSHMLELQFTAQPKSTLLSETVFQKGVDNKEDLRKKWEAEIEEIQLKVDAAITQISQIESQNTQLESSIQQMADLTVKESENVTDVEKNYRVKKVTLSLFPDAENNIKKLQNLILSSSQRLENLNQQWEQHKQPLVEKLKELKETTSQQQNEMQQKLEEVKDKYNKIQEAGAEGRYKEELYKKLQGSYEKLTKDLNRSVYTRRILEIVSNIKKQKAEIDKVLLDIRNVQKEINRLSGKLERTFTVTDELIFRDAKKDEAVRRAYKLLAALHENCSQSVKLTEETGVIVREIRELEDQIEQENQKKIIATLGRITSDYKQMQQENNMLLTQLREK